MQTTLRQFIEPANIPKKYGGELEFEFGDMPKLDPAVASTLEWEGNYKDFPHGPMFWVDKGDRIELKASGYVDGKQRMENVCTLPKKVKTHTLEELSPAHQAAEKKQAANGEKDALVARESRPELLSVPTAKEGVPQLSSDADNNVEPTAPVESTKAVASESAPIVQAGEIVPASRPEPVSFVTAHDGLKDLTLNGNGHTADTNGAATNGGPHKTQTANALDPALHQPAPTEKVQLNHNLESEKHHVGLKEKIKNAVSH